MFSSDETSEGQLLLDVDDVTEDGNEMHRETMRKFYDKYRCGKAIDLRLAGQEGTRFAARRVVQHSDFRITVSMDEYVKSMLRPIEVPRGYLSNTKEISKELKVVWVGWRQQQDQTWRRLTQSFHLGMTDDRHN